MLQSITHEIKNELGRIYSPIQEELNQIRVNLISSIRPADSAVSAPFDQLEKMKGKLLRPAIVLLVAKEFGLIEEHHINTAHCIELVHLASLIHDDVVDHSDMRRGVESLNHLFGDEKALLVGDYLFSRGLVLLQGSSSEDASNMVARVIAEASLGELANMIFSFSEIPSESDYLNYIDRKTAGLFALSAELPALLSRASSKELELLSTFGRNFGKAFQIVDDCSDLFNEATDEGKPVGKDLREGHLTLPIIKMLGSASESWKESFFSTLKLNPDEAVQIMTEKLLEEDIPVYCLTKAADLMRTANKALADANADKGNLKELGRVFIKKLELLIRVTQKKERK